MKHGSISKQCLGTVLNVTISWHGIAVTILRSPITDYNSDTSAKYNKDLHDNICSTKLNNNTWSYTGNCAKCSIIDVTVLLLWSYPGNGAKYVSRLFVYQSSPCLRSVWKIRWKGMTQFIRNFFWRLGWFVGRKLPGCWQLKDKKNSTSTIINHLLERIDVTVICLIFL